MTKFITIVLGLPAILRLLVVVAATLFACRGVAQNNPYKINDQLYKEYMAAYKLRTKEDGLAMSQRLYDHAAAMGDRKAQCMALTIPVIYYAMHSTEDAAFEQAVKRLQDVSAKYGYEQYYYYGFTNRVNWLINKRRIYDAYSYVSHIEEEAQRQKSAYGSFTALNALGQVHAVRSEISLALNCFQKALEYGHNSLKGQDMAPMYRKIAECYEELYDYPRMLEYAEKGYSVSRSMATRLRSIRGVCYAAFMLGKYDTFQKYYKLYSEIGHEPDVKSPLLHERDMAIMKLMYDRKFTEAMKQIETLPPTYKLHQQRLAVELYRLRGDIKQGAYVMRGMYRGQVMGFDSVYQNNTDIIDSRITNQLLEFENRRLTLDHQKLLNEQQRIELHNSNLELANTQLSLNNSDLELQRTKSASSLMRFSYNNKQLEAAKLRGQIAAQQAEQHTHDLMIAAIFIVCIVIMVAVAAFTYNHNRLMARLRHTNDTLARNNRELSEAKEKAEAANHAKTAFINNMGNDIRHPLAEVARYSRIIANSSASASAEERRTNDAMLNANTQALLSIVDKVIDKAQTAV